MPQLFNGTVYLLRDRTIDGETLRAPFSSLTSVRSSIGVVRARMLAAIRSQAEPELDDIVIARRHVDMGR
ncbi:MAG TPA: hypothetical protein VIG38_15385 [Hyphomicrobium sp.]|jgi:hypothetical protein